MIYDDDDLLAYSANCGPMYRNRRRRRITKIRLLRQDDSLHIPAISTDSGEPGDVTTAKRHVRRRRDQPR